MGSCGACSASCCMHGAHGHCMHTAMALFSSCGVRAASREMVFAWEGDGNMHTGMNAAAWCGQQRQLLFNV